MFISRRSGSSTAPILSTVRYAGRAPYANPVGTRQVESSGCRTARRPFPIEPHECAQHTPKPVLIEAANQPTAVRDCDLPSFFGDDDRQGIGVLGHADGCPMAGAELAGSRDVVGQGKDDTGGNDAIAAREHRAVMQRGVWVEDVDEELAGEFCIDWDA